MRIRSYLAGALIISGVAIGCGSDREMKVSSSDPGGVESAEQGIFFGGGVHADGGVAIIAPMLAVDPGGSIELEDDRLKAAPVMFLARSNSDVVRLQVDTLPLGDQPVDLRAVGSRDGSVQLLVGRCTPSANAEFGACADGVVQSWWVYSTSVEGGTVSVGENPSLEGFLRSARPNEARSGFTALKWDADQSALTVVDIDGVTGTSIERAAVDQSFVDDSAVCIDGTGTVFGFESSEGDVSNLHTQDLDGNISATTISWEDGWFQELGCGDSGAWMLTSFGAIYELSAHGEPRRVLEVSPFGRTQGVRTTIVSGADGQPVAVVAAPGLDAEQDTFVAGVIGAGWGSAKGLGGALEGIKPGFAVTFDGATIAPFGKTTIDGIFYTNSAG